MKLNLNRKNLDLDLVIQVRVKAIILQIKLVQLSLVFKKKKNAIYTVKLSNLMRTHREFNLFFKFS